MERQPEVKGHCTESLACPHCAWSAIRVGPPGSAASGWLLEHLQAHVRARHAPAAPR